jgi:transcriptional regulator with XRE-family HTH domain
MLKSMPSPDPRTLIRRRLDGKTQAALAAELGITPAYLSDILNFRREPGRRVLKALGLQKVVSYRQARPDLPVA